MTGHHGQVVQSLVERAPADTKVVALGRPELDLAGACSAIVSTVSSAAPDVIVSAAAFTHVDRAESDPELAYAVNERGPRALAIAARNCGVPLIHLSTDYVFDGEKTSPYVEEDSTRPMTIYGCSKLAGEQAVLAEHQGSTVLRTAWVYSPFGVNFVKTMLRLAAGKDEIAVVCDQRGNPTSALDIADAVLAVAANLTEEPDAALQGIFHMTSAGDASWAEFAEAIFRESANAGGPSARVKHISSADYPTAATRPRNSRLDSTKLERFHGVRLPEWQSSLNMVVSRLLNSQGQGGIAV